MFRVYFISCFVLFVTGCSQLPVKEPTVDELVIASFNVSMEAGNYIQRNEQVDLSVQGAKILMQHLASGKNQQIKNIAEIIQRARPDIILLNEFDYIDNPQLGVKAFIDNYLSKPQGGAQSINYPYYFYAQSNTGLPTTFDLDNNGKYSKFGADAYGFGLYPGQYGMVLLSRYPIDTENIRTFQRFLWSDMPGALKPIIPDSEESFYNDMEWANLRLSSKSHWDIPVTINGKTLHVLASHPTPPVFDGPEDRNGKRNNDEIRFWLDYVTQEKSNYIYDDRGISGGLDTSASFVILGDLNASSDRVELKDHAIKQLLASERVSNDYIPRSESGALNRPTNPYGQYHTASWGARADYVIPSSDLKVMDGAVFWPSKDDELYRLVEDRASSSDHYLVWLKVSL